MNKEDISEKLEIAAIAEDNTIEAFVHKDLPGLGLCGTQKEKILNYKAPISI